MIYLVQLDNAYKIGYAKDVNKRIKNLSSTHVIVNLIDSKEELIKMKKNYIDYVIILELKMNYLK